MNTHRLRRSSRAAFLAALVIIAAGVSGADADPASGRVHQLKITILSTMLADRHELGEWGFSALVDADGHLILFDTGAHPDLVETNAHQMGIAFSSVPEVILSHNHPDHTGGFMTLRRAVMAQAPTALAKTHVATGIFYPRSSGIPQVEANVMIKMKAEYEATGGVFIVHDSPAQLYPGVWLTGPVPRKYPEHNWSTQDKVKGPDGWTEDTLPEDMSLVIDTDKGLVIVTGCGHAGVVNIVDYARHIVRPARIHALIGGIHLFDATDETLGWTTGKLAEVGVDNFIGAHCTGIETVFRFRRDLGLDRAHAVVGAVGASFDLGKGIDPGYIAQ